MANFISNWSSKAESLPEDYVVPTMLRPGTPAPIFKDIPVIDLGGDDRVGIVQKVLKAARDFGMFQVINHGISESLMFDTVRVFKEFFGMPVEEKEKVLLEDAKNGFKLYTSTGDYFSHDFKYWKDTLHIPCDLRSQTQTWSEKPQKYREIIEPYIIEVRKLGMRILDLIYDGLNCSKKDSNDETTQALLINHYPVCPDPSLALGACHHCDPHILTLLQQDVYGLQLLKDGEWFGIEPIPNAFVINTGILLEIISNGILKSAMHRAITNSTSSRTSIVTFIGSNPERTIEPSSSLVSPQTPPLFKSFKCKDFHEIFFSKTVDYEATMEHFKL